MEVELIRELKLLDWGGGLFQPESVKIIVSAECSPHTQTRSQPITKEAVCSVGVTVSGPSLRSSGAAWTSNALKRTNS